MRISIKRTYIRLLTLFAVLGIYSCKKTEFVDYERQPLNRILEYNITNAKQLLQGAIDQRTSVITVYIPYYLSIDHLIADIKLDEGAVLLFR